MKTNHFISMVLFYALILISIAVVESSKDGKQFGARQLSKTKIGVAGWLSWEGSGRKTGSSDTGVKRGEDLGGQKGAANDNERGNERGIYEGGIEGIEGFGPWRGFRGWTNYGSKV
uniref:Glycine-rich protein n=1 Tax=Galega orientalis TaxID=47654 RepID=A0A411AFH0_9FABA|nr:glycine-rich protein [Galega orientalis]